MAFCFWRVFGAETERETQRERDRQTDRGRETETKRDRQRDGMERGGVRGCLRRNGSGIFRWGFFVVFVFLGRRLREATRDECTYIHTRVNSKKLRRVNQKPIQLYNSCFSKYFNSSSRWLRQAPPPHSPPPGLQGSLAFDAGVANPAPPAAKGSSKAGRPGQRVAPSMSPPPPEGKAYLSLETAPAGEGLRVRNVCNCPVAHRKRAPRGRKKKVHIVRICLQRKVGGGGRK